MDERLPHLNLYLHLTRACSLRCRYCYAGEKFPEAMLAEVGAAALDFFLDRARFLMVRFFGGEPLLEWETLRRLTAHAKAAARARGAGVKLTMITNGIALTPEVVEFCRAEEIDYSLSFDGCREAQDANRVLAGGGGSFDIIDGHLDHLLACNPYVNVVSVVNPDNLAYLEDSFRYFVERGFTFITLSPDFTHPGFAACLPELRRRYEALAERYLEERARGRRLVVGSFDRRPYDRERCEPGRGTFSVAPDGRIYPCTAFLERGLYPLGDVWGGFDEGLTGTYAPALARFDAHLREAHAACPPASVCHRGCACTNLVTTGAMDQVSPLVCEHGRLEEEVRAALRARLAALGRDPRAET